MNPTNNTTNTFPQNFTPSPKVANPQENQDAKIAGTAKKVFIVLGIILVGAVVTTAVAITLIPFGPTAVTASIVTGVALTILAVVLAIYFLTRSNVSTQNPTQNKSFITPLQVIGDTNVNPKSLGEKLAEDAVCNFDKFSESISLHDLECFAQSLIDNQNRYKLSQLNKKLKEEVGETVALVIMNDWDLIGHDIRVNRVLLDNARINLILEHAKQIQTMKENTEGDTDQLNVLKGILATGDVPERKLLIEKNFPLLGELTQHDSQQEKKLKTSLQEAAVKQQIKQSPLFSPSKGEKDVYKMLKLPLQHINPLQTPKSIHCKAAFILLENSPFFEEGEEIFISKVKNHIKKYAVEDRIEQMTQKDSSEQLQKAKAHLSEVQTLIHLRDRINAKKHLQNKEPTKTPSESNEEMKKHRKKLDNVYQEYLKL